MLDCMDACSVIGNTSTLFGPVRWSGIPDRDNLVHLGGPEIRNSKLCSGPFDCLVETMSTDSLPLDEFPIMISTWVQLQLEQSAEVKANVMSIFHCVANIL